MISFLMMKVPICRRRTALVFKRRTASPYDESSDLQKAHRVGLQEEDCKPFLFGLLGFRDGGALTAGAVEVRSRDSPRINTELAHYRRLI
jgi:hypothetical protein